MREEWQFVVYKDHAEARGFLSVDVINIIMKICKKLGFTHITSNEDGIGLKFIRKP